MADKGIQTRERILAVAEPLILNQGFAGTSLDDILKAAKLTKGAFFHHFSGKADLARALVERYARNDLALFEGFAAEADARTGDPLAAMLHMLRRFEEFMQSPEAPQAGCVFAAYTYESMQFDPSVNRFIADSLRRWSTLYEERFEAVIANYSPARPVSARDLAEMVVSIIEGAFIFARSYQDRTFVARQSKQFRQYLELLFGEPKMDAGGGTQARRATRRTAPAQ